jgi:peptidyl-prolyl cis-trans isomerase A (cyclophilin A)
MMPLIRIETAYGVIDIEPDIGKAPKTAAHFLRLIHDGYLQGAEFYRIVRSSGIAGVAPTIDIIQGGVGWERCMTLPEVEHEPTDVTGLRHRDGTISLARSAEKNASSEFFICIGDQPLLDAGAMEGPGAIGFAAFGQVRAGMDVVRRIQGLVADAEPPGGDARFRNQFLTEPPAIVISIRE